MVKVITIPKKIAKEDKLVLVSWSKYSSYLELKKIIPVVKLNQFEKKEIKQSRKEIKNGESISLNRFKDELGCWNCEKSSKTNKSIF